MIRHISSVALAAVLVSVCACSKNDVLCRMRQNDAKVDLERLNEAEAHFREQHGHFATSAELAFTPPDPEYYDVAIESATADTYRAKAMGKRRLAGDEWSVDQLGNPILESNACR